MPDGFCYNSGTNEHFLSVEDLRQLITEHVATESASTGVPPVDHGRNSRSPIPILRELAPVA